ncbi:MAG: sigma-54 dependent transcriptional regulator [bacterium]|nr:sigma-54 dependent transcriptional regulator [bacterium]
MQSLFAPAICEEPRTRAELLDRLVVALKELTGMGDLLLTAIDPRRRQLIYARRRGSRTAIERGVLDFRGPILPRFHRPIHPKLLPLFARIIELSAWRSGALRNRPELMEHPRTAREFHAQLNRFADEGYSYSAPLMLRGEICGFLFFTPTRLRKSEERSAKLLQSVEALRRPLAMILRNYDYYTELKELRSESEVQLDRLTNVISSRKSETAAEDPVDATRSRVMRGVWNQIREWAGLDYPALIQGETGTGKERAAATLHRLSSRREKNFVAVNCATIPENLWEAEVFGYSKGAFTDAKSAYRGLIEQAGGGTLFFDEIGETPLNMQSRLLRLLQEKSYRPIGQERTRKAGCRFVFATNRDLEAEVAAGRFRQDLYYRIAVFQIQLPPLRKRREDIPDLVNAFIKSFASSLLCDIRRAAPEVLALFENYAWPGNIRELQNVLLRSMAGAAGQSLELRHIGPVDLRRLQEFRGARLRSPANDRSGQNALRLSSAGAPANAFENDDASIDYSELVKDYKKGLILRALEKTGGNKRRSAELLGLSPQTLDYQIRSLALEYTREIRIS